MKTLTEEHIAGFQPTDHRRGFERLRKAARVGADLAEFIAEAARQANHRRRQRKAMRAQLRLLAELDERTLKDIGFARAEIGSISAEIGGHAETTRRRIDRESVAPLY